MGLQAGTILFGSRTYSQRKHVVKHRRWRGIRQASAAGAAAPAGTRRRASGRDHLRDFVDAGVGCTGVGTILESDAETGRSGVIRMSTLRACLVAICALGAIVMVGLRDFCALPWAVVPGAILLAYSIGPAVQNFRAERRLKAEAAEGLARMEGWLRTAPALSTASLGAAVEYCPICRVPVDPRTGRCRRHGAPA